MVPTICESCGSTCRFCNTVGGAQLGPHVHPAGSRRDTLACFTCVAKFKTAPWLEEQVEGKA